MKIYALFFCSLLIISCSSSNKIYSPTTETRALDTLISNKQFTIQASSASPQPTNSIVSLSNSGLLGAGNTAGNISLIGNSNHLTVKGDSISIDLPYYGERQMGGGYNSESGVKFNGIPKEYTVTKDERTQRHTINFKVRGEGTELFTINAIIFPNWKTNILVTSSQRTPIRYQGEVSEIKKKD